MKTQMNMKVVHNCFVALFLLSFVPSIGLLNMGCGEYQCDKDAKGEAVKTPCGTKPDLEDTGCHVHTSGVGAGCIGCKSTGETYRAGKYQTCTNVDDPTDKGTEADCKRVKPTKCYNGCKEVTITGANCSGITSSDLCAETYSCGYVDPGKDL